jgi:hypothetical protein
LILAELIFEINHFEGYSDLYDAKDALEENVTTNWDATRARFLLVILYIRQHSIPIARDYLQKAMDNLSGYANNDEKFMVSRAEFELASAEGRWGDAISASKSSLEIIHSFGSRWEYARRLIDLADAHLGRNEPGDLEKARETYQQSLDMFTEMGAPGYIKVLEERLGEL